MEVDLASEDSENARPNKAAPPKAKVKPKKPLQPSGAANDGERALEDIYQKKSQLEHVLLRPDTYIGSTEKQQQKMWVHKDGVLKFEEIDYVPGLFKIFDEILVNAADNKVRDPKMDKLMVNIDKDQNLISVWNNGDGVPVEIHKEERVYIPELIFGHLLTSSNYDDTEKKVTGGRNGYGAKLANIFSTEFTIETCDGKRQRRYKQGFSSNMAHKTEPKITACKAVENWTCVSFRPDLAKFGMEQLEDDTLSLMRKRVYDLAGILGKGVKVFLDGEQLKIKSFLDYVRMYLGDGNTQTVHERVSDRWEVVVAASSGQFQQVSFVNSICTIKGGTHVNCVADQLTKGLMEVMTKSKEHKKTAVKPFMVRNYLSVFVNCMIENPAFDSQTKETLTLRASSFGSRCDLSDKFVRRVGSECGVVDLVASFAEFKSNKELKKSDGGRRGRLQDVPKLIDAPLAATQQSDKCTLILCEGDSAKSLVVAGLNAAGRDRFGVFPLRGKLLNVRDATTAQVAGNAELKAIKQIMGLQHGKEYADTKLLRYGHLMIMADQDHDGSHIKGLLMNFLHHFFPSLLRMPGFLLEFITPIVKATKGKQTKAFFSMPEYEAWGEEVNTSGWTIKYYKGLGTSTNQEAVQYFSHLDHHRKSFVWTGEGDGDSLDLAFSKKRVEARKAWLQSFEPGTFLDQSVDEISYRDFINKELILFSVADLERSIPSMVDGLKPGQRKILYCCFKKKLKTDIKVGQLAGYVAEHSAYHHGEASLQSTIVGLAQSYVGTNNVNLLVPSGQFGTRLQGGKDAASARYIFTRLDEITRAIFHEADDNLLHYLTEEGQSIEPTWYMPVLPMVLVNGAEGIGTGWSTSIPTFNPRDVIANLRRLLGGEAPLPMHPWYRGFVGAIEEVNSRTDGRAYTCHGVVGREGDEITIRELPIRTWTQSYKENVLEPLLKSDTPSAQPPLADLRELHDVNDVNFELSVNPGGVIEADGPALLSKFKLTSRIALSNMVLFDVDGKIKRYASPEDILKDFFGHRIELYGKRKAWLIQHAEDEMEKLSNRVRFISAVNSGELVLSGRRRPAIEEDLDSMGFARRSQHKPKAIVAGAAAVEDAQEPSEPSGGYAYLLDMALGSLTLDKVEALRAEEARQRELVATTRLTTPEAMYVADLDALEAALDAFEGRREREAEESREAARRAGGGGRRGGKKAGKRRGGGGDSGESEDDGDYAPRKPKAAARKPPSKAKPSQTTSSKAHSSAAGPSAARPAQKAAPKAAAAKRPAKAASAASSDLVVVESQAVSQLPDEERSMTERIRDRLNGLSVQTSSQLPSTAGTAAQPSASTAAGGRQPRRAAAKKAIVLSDTESDASEASFEESSSEKESPTKKRKTAPKPQAARSAVGRLQEQSVAQQVEVTSPAVTQLDKVRRIRPSPFHKGSGEKRVPTAPAAGVEAGEEAAEPSAPQQRGARPARRAAAAAKTYALSTSGSEEDASEEDASEASGSDFEASESD